MLLMSFFKIFKLLLLPEMPRASLHHRRSSFSKAIIDQLWIWSPYRLLCPSTGHFISPDALSKLIFPQRGVLESFRVSLLDSVCIFSPCCSRKEGNVGKNNRGIRLNSKLLNHWFKLLHLIKSCHVYESCTRKTNSGKILPTMHDNCCKITTYKEQDNKRTKIKALLQNMWNSSLRTMLYFS